MKAIRRLFGFIFLILILVCSLFVWSGYREYKKAISHLPISDAVSQIRQIKNYTPIEDVPKMYVDAVISAEDRRFYYHNGFDIIGTLRAIVVDIKSRALVEGGSTITQQLAKNIYFMEDRTPVVKLAEIFISFQIEKEYEKDDIFELYMNKIYFGSGYYNIYDASVGYFNKLPKQLNDYEATLLAGVVNAPSVYSPKVNLELSHKRQEKIVECLVECDYIDQKKADEILMVQKDITD